MTRGATSLCGEPAPASVTLTLILLLASPALPSSPPDEAVSRLAVEGARRQVGQTVHYDGQYRRLAYPGGDLPPDRGSCTDVIVRAYRNAGIDLQRLVHEDMAAAFEQYPRTWGLPRPDPSIDHRRVPNLAVFFRRHGATVPISDVAADYLAGDIVVWAIPTTHIGIVSDATTDGRRLVVHNIGAGAVLEDALFAFRITGHFRYPSTQPGTLSTQARSTR